MGTGEMRAAVYVHFPFCTRKCSYCDFNSRPVRRGDLPHDAYASAVLCEWSARTAQMPRPPQVQSLYFGGGTPSLWSAQALRRVIQEISTGGFAPDDMEITVECNPCSLDDTTLDGLRSVGATRLSVGVQSTSDQSLKLLGRAHSASQALDALRAARKAGVARVSADLIIGLPGQKPCDVVADADAIIDCGVDHLSAYLLTLAAPTPLARAIADGLLDAVDETDAAACYVALSDHLVSRGFDHYEVSNFSRPGCESLHNTWVWRGGWYLGLGAGAVGTMPMLDGRAVRTRNDDDPVRYVEQMMRSGGPDLSGGTREELSAETRMTERIMLGLRMAEGVDIDAASRELGVQGWTRTRQRAAAMLQERGRIERMGGRVRIPRRAWLFENDTVCRLA
jgi:putative oxygen-independent coproporphyrinogen III oxidase